jgi:hypothetical protein
MSVYAVAAVWLAMALAASLISIRVGISVALIEIVVGAVAGNLPWLSSQVEQTAFTAFLATIGPDTASASRRSSSSSSCFSG